MEIQIMREIANRVEKGENVALVTLIQVDGSSPGKKGNLMAVFENKKILGTVGGGNLEYTLIQEAINSMQSQESKELEFDLIEDAALHMKCGGKIKAFIKVFKKRDKLIIIGGGHVGTELYNLGVFLEMDTVIFDDRIEFCNDSRFPQASELILGEIDKNLENYKLDKNSYIVIVSRGHLQDKASLIQVLKQDTAYIGMIGSRKKIIETYKEILETGESIEKLKNVYSPIGLDISSGSPKEIAISIIAEILTVKNKLTGKHMRDVKKIELL